MLTPIAFLEQYTDGHTYVKIGHSPHDPLIAELDGDTEDEQLRYVLLLLLLSVLVLVTVPVLVMLMVADDDDDDDAVAVPLLISRLAPAQALAVHRR